eukprot:GFUD01078139.1.p1 GENE.GFUD01078139.1~~GFUD01078139.1.p1  ORF type:complete len:436 (-),score=114.60 GFUD01078139.1:465-1772(-)
MSDPSKYPENSRVGNETNSASLETETAWDSLFTGRVDDSTINFSIGAPGPSILSSLPGLFLSASSHRLSTNLGSLFQYGPEVGIRQYRIELARFLTRRYGDKVLEDELLLTCGATNGLHLTISSLVKQGGTVFVEDPTYFIALSLLSGDMGLRVVPIRMGENGMDTEHLEEMVVKEAARNVGGVGSDGDRFWGLIYTIPTFHNPTGTTFSTKTGSRMVEIARQSGLLVFCDDVYNLLPYHQLDYSRLKSLDTSGPGSGSVISNGTFSKILAPGVRLGWLEAPTHLVERLTQSGVLQSGGSQNNYVSGIVTSLLELGLVDQHLDNCIKVYKERMDAAVGLLEEGLPQGWRVKHPHGGYFLWLVGDHGDLGEFCQWMEKEKGIVVLLGSKASPFTYMGEVVGGNMGNCFRICIAFYDLDKIVDGCKVLCTAVKEYFP